MTQEQWDEVERLYHELSTQPSSGWGTLLEQACPDDESVRREVRRLLEQTVSGTGLLNDSPPIHRGFLVSPAPDLAGHRIGAFTILQRIGAGGMGEVYRARDNRLQRDVAIKILPPVFTADVDRRARFEREARLLASLNHPNIAAIYGFEETEGIRGLVLELVEGPTLADRLENGPLPCAEALPIARQIADALAAAHEQGVIHRDVKPANIKVRSDGTVKVLDFGLAKNVTGNLPDESEVATAEYFSTNQGQIIGTAPYMSPEQARGAAVDRRADVWAFGCVLYEMLTGKRAFPGQHVTDILAAVLRGEPDWNALPADTPTSIRRLLRRSLLKDPQDRLADMSVAQLEIDDAVGEERASERPVKPSAARTNNRNGVLAAVGILILLASISLWFLL
jgi:serine/threonine protein kinase